MKLKKDFLSSDVVRILDISQNLLTQWIDRGFVKASQPASGSGTRNVFCIEDLCRIELFKQLLSAGFTRKGAASIAFGSEDGAPEPSFITQAISESIKVVLSGTYLEKSSLKDKVIIAVSKFKLGKDASLSSWPIKNAEDFLRLYNYEGSMWENNIVYLINFTNIALQVINKIKEVSD
jgi:hypothetical protein